MEIDAIINQVSRIIHVPETFLQFPQVITNLIIPFFFFSYLLKYLLNELRIFRNSPVNWGIACVISFISLLWLSILAPFITIGSIFYLSYKKLGLGKGIVVGIIGTALYLAIPSLIGLLMSFIPAY